MKKIIHILIILLISVTASSQDTILMRNSAGDLMSFNGQLLKYISTEATNPPAPDNYEEIWAQDFESSAIEDPYTLAHIEEDFPWETNYTNGFHTVSSYVSGDLNDHVSIATVGGSRVMVHNYPPDGWGVGTEGGNTSGGTALQMVAVFEPVNGVEEVYFGYNIMYEPGFDFGIGGKLAGITAYEHIIPSDTEGTLNVAMWEMNAELQYYGCWRDHGTSGRHINDFEFIPGVWYHICRRYVQGDVGSGNAIDEMFIDGILVDNWSGQISRKRSYIGWNAIEWSFFAGGGDSDWSTPGDHDMYIDNAQLFYLSGPGTAEHPVGLTVSPTGRDISDYINLKEN